MGMGDIANSGMQAAMQNMSVISNNIANAGTYAFKRSSISFTDLFPSGNNASSVQIGLGVQAVGTQQSMAPGGPSQTGLDTDMCIGGNGFFVLKNPNSGQVNYSRYGHFDFDKTNGYIMLGNSRLQGFPAVNGSVPSGSSPADLHINTGMISATPSTAVSQNQLNLNPSDKVPVTTTFSPTDATSYNYTTTSTIYDSLGTANKLQLYYVKSSTSNTWTVNAYVTTPQSASATSVGTGTLTFNSNGTLNTSTGLNALSFSPTSGAATPQVFSVNMTGATQSGTTYGASAFTVDGNTAGAYDHYTVDENGNVTASYTNGQNLLVGQVAVATFQSPQNLQNIGDQLWAPSTNSGAAFVNQMNSLNNVSQGALELSNVDLATEMVSLINAQNAFQANAQVQQVFSQVMQTVTKL
jgi:flagellar hook protein FlgE